MVSTVRTTETARHFELRGKTLAHAAPNQLTLADVLETQAWVNRNQTALSDADRSYTFAELNQLTNRLARGLQERGVSRSDTIAILGNNSIEHVLLQHAAAKLGVALAILSWRQTADELSHALDLVAPRLVFVQQRYLHVVKASEKWDLVTLTPGGSSEFYRDHVEPFDASALHVHLDPEDIVTIIYTSGTTGRPKAAAMSHRAYIARAAYLAKELQLTQNHAHLAWAPMYSLASGDFILTCAVLGSRYIVVDGFNLEAINEYLHTVQLGWLPVAPGMYEKIIARLKLDKRPVIAPKLVGAMADLVPPAQVAELTSLVQAPFNNSYGMTEAGPLNRNYLPPGSIPSDLGKELTSLARYRLVGANGEDVVTGEVGELWVAGPTLFSEYINDPKATAEALSQGWYHTGDLFHADEAGKIHYFSRSKYLIKSGAANIYPAEIERVLLDIPGVQEATVVKKPDEHWGETPVAFIAMEGVMDPATMEAECRRHLSGYKVPREYRQLALDAFPRNDTGKVVREKLEELLTAVSNPNKVSS